MNANQRALAMAHQFAKETTLRRTEASLWIWDGRIYRRLSSQEITRWLINEAGDYFSTTLVNTFELALQGLAPELPDPPHEFIAVPNGHLNLIEGKLYPASKKRAVRYVIPWKWVPNPKSERPHVRRFLNQITRGMADTREAIEEAIGYTLYPSHRLKRAFLLAGPSNTGKSLLLDLIGTLIGKENTAAVPMHSLCARRTFALAELSEALYNNGGELVHGFIQNAAQLKSITSGDLIQVERKYHRPENMRLPATHWFSTNSLVQADDATNAFFERLLFIPLDRKFKKSEKMPKAMGVQGHPAKHLEMEGLLRIAVAGLQRLLERGDFATEGSVAELTKEARTAMSPVLSWIEQRCAWDRNARTQGLSLYSDFRAWCSEHGVTRVPSLNHGFYAYIREEAEREGHPCKTSHVFKKDGHTFRGVKGLRLRHLESKRAKFHLLDNDEEPLTDGDG